MKGKTKASDRAVGIAIGIALVGFLAGMTAGAALSFDQIFRVSPTIPTPIAETVLHPPMPGTPAHSIPGWVYIKTQHQDSERLAGWLRSDLRAHGGWVQDPKDKGASLKRFRTLVPESYVKRATPLIDNAHKERIHPAYQNWVEEVSAGRPSS